MSPSASPVRRFSYSYSCSSSCGTKGEQEASHSTLEWVDRLSLPCPERRGQEGRRSVGWTGEEGVVFGGATMKRWAWAAGLALALPGGARADETSTVKRVEKL